MTNQTKAAEFIRRIRAATTDELKALQTKALVTADEAAEIIASAVTSEIAYRWGR